MLDLQKTIELCRMPKKLAKKYLGSIENEINKGNAVIELDGITYTIPTELQPNYDSIDNTTNDDCSDYAKSFERQKEVDIEIANFNIEQDYKKSLQLEKNKEKYESKKQLHISTSKGCDCPRCGGSGKVRYNYANGICFKCFGTGKI